MSPPPYNPEIHLLRSALQGLDWPALQPLPTAKNNVSLSSSEGLLSSIPHSELWSVPGFLVLSNVHTQGQLWESKAQSLS